MSQIETEKCVLCNSDTGVYVNTHIDYRFHYIEGAGQLCKDCYEKSNTNKKLEKSMFNERDLIAVPRHYFKLYSNNYDLGEKLRIFYHENY